MHLTELSKNTESKFFSCGRGCSLPGDNFVANIFLFQIQDSYISFSIILKSNGNTCSLYGKKRMFRICEHEHTDGLRVACIQVAYARKLVRG